MCGFDLLLFVLFDGACYCFLLLVLVCKRCCFRRVLCFVVRLFLLCVLCFVCACVVCFVFVVLCVPLLCLFVVAFIWFVVFVFVVCLFVLIVCLCL